MADPALADFLNRLRILQSIDFHELKAAGLFNHEHEIQEWETFRTHPWSWMMHAPDADAAAVWAIVNRRSKQRIHLSNFDAGDKVTRAIANGNSGEVVGVRVHYTVRWADGIAYAAYVDSELTPTPEPNNG